MSIGANIKREREKKGLTRKQLAEKLGLTDVSISRYENNKRTPSIKILDSISIHLGVSMDSLTTKEERETLIKNKIDTSNKLIEKMKLPLTLQDKEILLNLIKYYNDTIFNKAYDLNDITDEHLETLKFTLAMQVKTVIKDLEIIK